MKIITVLLALGLMAALPISASAQDGKKKRDRKEALLKRFDKDGDGKLNKEEKAAAREAMKKHRGDKQPGGKHKKRAMKKKADRNGDGKMDRQERKDFRSKRGQRRK